MTSSSRKPEVVRISVSLPWRTGRWPPPFRLVGARNEWTARLPSALAVLAVAIAFVTVARASLGPRGSTIAALIWMTNIGMIEKGRLIEIEALYVALCGLAIIFWLSFWGQKKSPWLIWLPASIFLGLGLLAKGPTHLVFFYAIVLAVLWHAKDWRLLLHPAHFAALAIMLTASFACQTKTYINIRRRLTRRIRAVSVKTLHKSRMVLEQLQRALTQVEPTQLWLTRVEMMTACSTYIRIAIQIRRHGPDTRMTDS